MRNIVTAVLGSAAAMFVGMATSSQAAEKTTLTGELIDTWCYYSGVMGGPDATIGTAHHTCALWCAAGGIPVGLLAEDGTVYMLLGFEGEDPVDNDRILDLQTHEITVDGTVYQRDGLHYLTVERVIADAGIVNQNHEDFGPVPPFAIPELN